jgi:Tfp pilus assembly protein PilO
VQPEDFFSRDITLVKELEVLEGLKQRFNVQTQIGGISGTVTSAGKAKTTTPLAVIPYSISVTGPLSDVVDFIETLENLSFITNVNNVSVTAADSGKVNASMSADFYLRK